ncbi:Invasion protein B family protein [Pseudomonas sp. LAMO17WK12:I10]|uniref:InvB/SpaK family type III secretion system chaperone n=1 Tax=unclassified Pseudomonas TaxID=196821 RepID=UPI000BC85F89|nr:MULTISPECIES: Invasion protein B family [unclassified Pseudomonas]PXX53982.1 invasion protein B family protein [Pseudomonas sp. LAMO17WK12:I9]SNY51875.1 Invasion protein B family protein [Pseudomonas sp. LAMO17WK12:I10]
MQQFDIAGLLRNALELSGCTNEQIGSFDGHSTIELDMVGLPRVNVAMIDDELWFWSPLVESTAMLFTHRSEGLLRFLMQGFRFARNEQLQLIDVGDMLEVRVLLSPQVTQSPQALADALDAYLESLTQLCEVVR